MKRFTGILLMSFFIIQSATSQVKTTEKLGQAWVGYFNQTRFSQHWGTWAEGQLRTKEDVFSGLSQGIIRVGMTYYLSNDAKLTAGYAYVNHFPAAPHSDISRPEHRPWQQVQWHTKFSKWRMMQWFRLEERFRRKVKDNDELAEGHDFNFRARYNILTQFPFSKKHFQPGTFSWVVSDEAFINFGKQVFNNYFDQNRFFTGLHYHVNKTDQLSLNYFNVFQQLPAGNQYRSINGIRLAWFSNLDARKSKAEKN